MRAALFAIVISALVVCGCVQQPHTCEPPYIIKGNGCCIDNNNNGICDSDEEQPENRETKNYAQYEVKMYLSQFSPEPDSWYKLPPSPVRHVENYQIYNYPQNESYYDGGWFILYSKYLEEPISCLLREYHNSIIYSEESLRLTKKGFSGNVSGVVKRALFLKTGVPREVRYSIDCRGEESGIPFQDAYVVLLKPP